MCVNTPLPPSHNASAYPRPHVGTPMLIDKAGLFPNEAHALSEISSIRGFSETFKELCDLKHTVEVTDHGYDAAHGDHTFSGNMVSGGKDKQSPYAQHAIKVQFT